MAFTHLQFNDQLPHGQYLRRALVSLRDGRKGVSDLISVLTTMIDGDASSASQFTEMTARLGFADNATTFAAWNELNSLSFKLTTDASQDHVDAAISQALAKFG